MEIRTDLIRCDDKMFFQMAIGEGTCQGQEVEVGYSMGNGNLILMIKPEDGGVGPRHQYRLSLSNIIEQAVTLHLAHSEGEEPDDRTPGH